MAKILDKEGARHRIELAQAGHSAGDMHIRLSWSRRPGFLARLLGAEEIDLDLGCFYELRSGKKSLIDCLQSMRGQGGPRDQATRQGCYTSTPYIWHMGDSRDLDDAQEETIIINPVGIPQISRLVIYAYVFDGAARWSASRASVRISIPGVEDIELPIGNPRTDQRFCAVAELTFGDDTIEVERLLTFHDGHKHCDAAYCWGLKYAQP